MASKELQDAFSEFSVAYSQDADNYTDRKVATDDENGLITSTAWTSDEGYETAIIDAAGVHPVERYTGRDAAIAGHDKWREFLRSGGRQIVKLGGLGGIISDEDMELVPSRP